MPFKKGKSKKVVRENIAELMESYQDTGKIGNITPKNKEHARKIAVAIAMDKAGKTDKSKKRKKK